ncbi:MAG: NAD(P)-dependent oxidoreductase [Pelagibacterales bacterium]|nr:NAD(P)-dependent oxidoreductase [Pelagibacterales bacterium]
MNLCAITGASGVLGRKIRKHLPFKFYCFNKNITNYKEVNKWVAAKNFDLIIHLAAIVPTRTVNKNYLKAKKVNVNGTENLINALLKKKKKPEWLFFASTSHVYGIGFKYKKLNEKTKINPNNKYGTSKKMAENVIQKKLKNSKIKFCIGRIFSVTDTTQRPPYLIPSLEKKIKQSNNKLILKNLNHYRDFITTKNICSAIKILFKNKHTGIFNIGSGKNFFLRDIAQLIAKKYNKNVKFKNNKKTTFLIADNKKILKLGWKPKKFTNSLKYFY